MIEITASTTIQRPPEVVFAYLTDLEKLPQWAAGVLESRQTSPGPRGVGTTYDIVGQVMGRRVPGTYTITQYEAPHTFGGKNSGLLTFDEIYALEALDGATRLTQKAQVQPQGIFKLLAPLMRGALQQQLTGDLAKMKKLLEADQ